MPAMISCPPLTRAAGEWGLGQAGRDKSWALAKMPLLTPPFCVRARVHVHVRVHVCFPHQALPLIHLVGQYTFTEGLLSAKH